MLNDAYIQDIAEEIQQEAHKSVEYIMKHSKYPVSLQDAENVFFYRKLAEMEIRLRELESK